MQNETFQFTLRSKTYNVPLIYSRLADISPNISKSLIFGLNHQYHIESDVSDEVFQSFMQYLISDEIPDIQINNINEFSELSKEFHLLEEVIQNKKEEFGEYLVNLNGLHSKNSLFYEEQIASNLDEYLEKYGQELMKKPVQSLFNVFNHEKRRLTKHDLAYELIKQHHESTNDFDIFILLDKLDGSKLSRSNFLESLSLREERLNHMPIIDFSYLSNMFDKQTKLEEKVAELDSEIKNIQQEHEKEMKNMNDTHSNEIGEMKEMIESLTNRIKAIENKNQKLLNSQKNQSNDHIELTRIVDNHSHEIEDIQQTQSNKIEEMQQKFESLTNKIGEIENKNQKLPNSQKNQSNNHDELKRIVNNHLHEIENIQPISDQIFTDQPNLETPGIIRRLERKQKTPFDRLFVASQSSNDIYNLIDPNTNDDFITSDIKKKFFITFELKEPVMINGMKIWSSNYGYPKSFDISVDGQIVKSIKEAEELNGKNKEMTIQFDAIQGTKIQFIQTGQSWDRKSHKINIKRIEILSSEDKFSKGVFTTLIESSENHDPHKCPVIVSATSHDNNSFYLRDTNKNVYMTNINQWFQIEFICGQVILCGFRLKKGKITKIKNFKIICTNDVNKPEENWETLFEINEQEQNDFATYEFNQPSHPIKFVRLMQIGTSWNNQKAFSFKHLDFFGAYV